MASSVGDNAAQRRPVRQFHTFDLGDGSSKNRFIGLTFQKGQLVSTKIMKGLAQGHWVKTRIVDVNLRDGTLNMEVINNEKWNLKKLAVKVPFDHVNPDTSLALNDEHYLLSFRVDQLLKQVKELRKSKLQTKQMAEELELKLSERDYVVEDLQKQLEEYMEKVNILQRRLLTENGDDVKEEDLLLKAKRVKTQSWAQGDLVPVSEDLPLGVPLYGPAKSLPTSGGPSRRSSICGEETIEVLRLRKENEFLRAIAQNKPLDEIRKENANLKVSIDRAKTQIEGLSKSREDLQVKLKVQDYQNEGTKFLINKLQKELSEWRKGQRVCNNFTIGRVNEGVASPSSNLSQIGEMVSSPNSIALPPPSQSRTVLRYTPSESSLASEEMSQYSRGARSTSYRRLPSGMQTPSGHIPVYRHQGNTNKSDARNRSNVKPIPIYSSFKKATPARSVHSDWGGGFVRNRAGSRHESDAERSSIKSGEESFIFNHHYSRGTPSSHKILDVHGQRAHQLAPHRRSPFSTSSFRSMGTESQASTSSIGDRVLRPYVRDQDLHTGGNGSTVSSNAHLGNFRSRPENYRTDEKRSQDEKDGGWSHQKSRSKLMWSASTLGVPSFSSRPVKGTDRNSESTNNLKISRTQKAKQRRKRKHKVKAKERNKSTQSTLLGLMSSSRNDKHASSDSSSGVKRIEGSGRHIVL